MDAVEAAEAVLERSPEGVAHDAAEDLEQAQALLAYKRCYDRWRVPVTEGTLYSLVALLYLSKRLHGNVSGVAACCAFSACQREQLLCLISFGRHLEASDFNQAGDKEEVSELLEQLWTRHCLALKFKVASELCFERLFVDAQVVFHPSARAPTSPLREFVASKKCVSPTKSWKSSVEKGVEKGAPLQGIPRLFYLLAMITGSDYFVSLPCRVEGDARCKVLQCIDHELGLPMNMNRKQTEQLKQLREFVISAYKRVKHKLSWHSEEWRLVPLTIAEARMLLGALESDNVFCHLVTERSPQHVMMSHEMVVIDGTERARLFLARYDLPVFYHLPLTYAQLCTEEGTIMEAQAFSSFVLHRPAAFDKVLRQMTLCQMWGEPEDSCGILHMRPEDYARAGAPEDSKAWNVIKKFAYPLSLDPMESVEHACAVNLGHVCGDLVFMVRRLLDTEIAEKKAWLFSSGAELHDLNLAPMLREAGKIR